MITSSDILIKWITHKDADGFPLPDYEERYIKASLIANELENIWSKLECGSTIRALNDLDKLIHTLHGEIDK